MSLGPRLKRLEQQTGASADHDLIRDAIARLRTVELPAGEDRAAVAFRVITEALDGLELSVRVRDWDPDLRAALSEVVSQLTIDELRAIAHAPDETATWAT
jgi:hypothetical protein